MEVVALCAEYLICRETRFDELTVYICREDEQLFPFAQRQKHLVKRCHIELHAAKQSVLGPVAPEGFLVREWIEAGAVHVLHVWSCAIPLSELGKILLEPLPAVFCSRGSAESCTCSNKNIVRLPDYLGSPPYLLSVISILKYVIPLRRSAKKTAECKSGVLVPIHLQHSPPFHHLTASHRFLYQDP